MLGQVAGIVLVLRGQYRLGGLVQIVSSAIHVLKGEGFIGVIGGMRARAYASESVPGTRELVAGSLPDRVD
jgi:hypothetical protein